jgi:hypothetical protein
MRTDLLWGNLKERDHLGDLDRDWRIILKFSLKCRIVWHGWINLTQDEEKCKHGNEPFSSIKCL